MRVKNSIILLCALFVLTFSGCNRNDPSAKGQNPPYDNVFEEIFYDMTEMMYMTERVPRMSSYYEHPYTFDPQGNRNNASTVRYHLYSFQTFLGDSWSPGSVSCNDYSTMSEENRLVDITVSCNRKEQTLTFKKYTMQKNNRVAEVKYCYSVADHQLVCSSDPALGTDDFLTDILTDWVVYNARERGLTHSTQFSVGDWGNYDLILGDA